MTAFAVALSVLSLGLASMNLLRHTSRATLALLLPKFLASALAPYVAAAGVLGAVLGLIRGSGLAIVAGTAGALLAADHLRRISADHDGFEGAFGTDGRNPAGHETARARPRRQWSWCLPGTPEPRWKRDVVFWTIPGTDRDLLCDIWQPPTGIAPSGTAIVYLHGSAWHLMDKDVLTRRFFRRLAAQGHVVMDVAYRLCPEVDVTGMVGDAKRAIAWMKAHAAEYGVRPEGIVIAGASAGGQVALLAAYTPGDSRLTPEELRVVDTTVLAAVSYYGVTDLRAYCEHTAARLADRPEEPAAAIEGRQRGRLAMAVDQLLLGRTLPIERCPPTPPHRRMMRNLVGGLPDEVPEMYNLASPVHHVGPACPPTLLFHGEHDSFVPVASARHLHQALRAAGVPAVYVEFPRTEHAFDLMLPPLQAPAAQLALHDLERFLECVSAQRPA